MKTEAVTKSIINNYKILSERTAVKSNQGDIKTVWGLNYKPNKKSIGYVNEVGVIERKKAKIELKDGELKKVKKPFFSTWNKTLININKMLESIILNYENSEVVGKKYVNLLIFPKEFVDRLSKIKW